MKSKIYIRLTMIFTTILMFTFIATSQTTITSLSLPGDNNEERASDVGGDVVGSNDFESSDLEIVFDAETQFVGMIFRDLAIPVGATITNAYVQFTVDAVVPGVTDAEMPPLTIYGAKEANVPDPFTDVLFTVSSHPQTTAQVTGWMPGPSVAEGDAGVNEQTPDISTIIAEIIALDGWAPGNSIMIVITADPNLTENINREMESSNGGDAHLAPTLVVTYTEDAPQEETISVQISDAGDDTEEVAEEGASDPIGTMDAGSSDLEFIMDDGFLQFVGMIFRDVQIPPNANITNAYIQFASDKALDGGPVTCKFFGGAVANMSAPFSEDLFSISSIAPTMAEVSWTVPPFGDPGVATEAERSPDISAIIAEIVATNGWASGNNLMIGVQNDSDGKIANREAISYDGDPALAPILNVTFTEGPSGVDPIQAEISSLIYPNPSEGILNIKNPSSDNFSYQIYTINGKLVSSRHHITGATTEVDLSDLVKGMYFVNVRTTEKTETHKLILK